MQLFNSVIYHKIIKERKKKKKKNTYQFQMYYRTAFHLYTDCLTTEFV